MAPQQRLRSHRVPGCNIPTCTMRPMLELVGQLDHMAPSLARLRTPEILPRSPSTLARVSQGGSAHSVSWSQLATCMLPRPQVNPTAHIPLWGLSMTTAIIPSLCTSVTWGQELQAKDAVRARWAHPGK